MPRIVGSETKVKREAPRSYGEESPSGKLRTCDALPSRSCRPSVQARHEHRSRSSTSIHQRKRFAGRGDTRHHPEASVGPGHDERSGPARRRVLTMSPCLTAISGVFGLSIFAVVQLSRWCAPTRTPRACAAAVASWHVVRARGRGSGGPAAAGQVELDVRGTSLSGTSHHLHYEGWCTAGWARRRAQ